MEREGVGEGKGFDCLLWGRRGRRTATAHNNRSPAASSPSATRLMSIVSVGTPHVSRACESWRALCSAWVRLFGGQCNRRERGATLSGRASCTTRRSNGPAAGFSSDTGPSSEDKCTAPAIGDCS